MKERVLPLSQTINQPSFRHWILNKMVASTLMMIKLFLNIFGVILINVLIASFLLTIVTVLIYCIIAVDCGSNNEDDCYLSDVDLEEANFSSMINIQPKQICYFEGKYLLTNNWKILRWFCHFFLPNINFL